VENEAQPQSPISVLRDYLFPTLRSVCPERANDLFGILECHSIICAFDDARDRILFQADTANLRIIVGTQCLERLWSLAYCYFVFFDEMRKANLSNPKTREVGFQGNQTLEMAGELLAWATSVDWQISAEGNHRQDPLPPWPEGLPRPIQNPEHGTNEDVADKLFLTAVGFILHHELAHIALGHSPAKGVDSIQQENEADRAAAAWLLDDLDQNDKRFVQRILGIAVALLWPAAINVYVPSPEHPSHPPGYDRLSRLLSQFVEDDNHQVWAFVRLALETHMHGRRLNYATNRKAASQRDAVEYYMDVISRAHMI